MDFNILPERSSDAALIDPLLDRAFGTDRKSRTVYRLREGILPLPELCFSAVQADGTLLASLRFWPILIDAFPAILLGPLAVEPEQQGRGIGKALVRHGLNEASRLGHKLCVVVGDPSYYRPYGFAPATPYGLVLPGPVDPPRFQVLELKPGVLENLRGLIRRAENHAVQPGVSCSA
ncbi:MAG TPA: N-acetyltransferase [Kiloniellales bacterium]|nr:N-acetyltransferase [Kiloniellales bacterium]